MTSIDRDRLAKLLGRLGSDYPGERDNAARMATDLVRDSGSTWAQVLAGGGGIAEEAAARCSPKTKSYARLTIGSTKN
jgi:hypothetical protein